MSQVFIEGFLVFKKGNITERCPVHLRRTAVNIDWCNGHGSCYRNSKDINDVTCCCVTDYKGQSCEVGPTTTFTTMTTTTLATTTLPKCDPTNDCFRHYTCSTRGEKLCLQGWTGPDCDVMVVDGAANCDNFDSKKLVPSEWTGNYTCPDDATTTWFTMNITRSTNIETMATVLVRNQSFPLSGSYASIFQLLTLMNALPISRPGLNGLTYSEVELNAWVRSPDFIDGFVVFKAGNQSVQCPVELRRTAVNIDWCNGHGTCFRYSKYMDDFTCCCQADYHGKQCESSLTTVTMTTPSTKATTRGNPFLTTTMDASSAQPITSSIPTTSVSTTPIPCQTVHSCFHHYDCHASSLQVCANGWTGSDCNVLIPDSEADCNSFFGMLSSTWSGNFTCPDDNLGNVFSMNITRSSDIDTTGSVSIDGTTIKMSGTFFTLFSFLSLQNDDVVTEPFYGRNFSKVRLDGQLVTPAFLSGVVLFTRKVDVMRCPVELRRSAVQYNWCGGRGSCYRVGTARDDVTCCCQNGYTGSRCEQEPSTTAVAASTTATSSITTTTSVSPSYSSTTNSASLESSTTTSSRSSTIVQTGTDAASSTTATATKTSMSSTDPTMSLSTTASKPSTSSSTIKLTSTDVPSTTITATTTATSLTDPTMSLPTTSPKQSTSWSTSNQPGSNSPTTTTTAARTTTSKSSTKQTMSLSTMTSIPSTWSTSTTPTTTTLGVCPGHFTCSANGQSECLPWFSGLNCNIPVPGTTDQCVKFDDAKDLDLSTWQGQFKCPKDSSAIPLTLRKETTGLHSTLKAQLNVQGTTVNLTGTFASYLKSLTFQSAGRSDLVQGKNYGLMEVHSKLTSPVRAAGAVLFVNADRSKTICSLELDRTDGGACGTSTPPSSPTTTTAAYLDPGRHLEVYIELVEEEYEKALVVIILRDAWETANSIGGKSNTTFNIAINYTLSMVDKRGTDVLKVSYTVTPVNVSDPSTVLQPSLSLLETALQKVYSTRMYHGSVSELIDVSRAFHLFIKGPRPEPQVVADIEERLCLIWKMNSSLSQLTCSGMDDISVKKTEEYMGDMGIEITKISYLIVVKGITVDSAGVVVPESTYFNTEIEKYTGVEIYTGSLMTRYRFHHDLFITDYIYRENITDLVQGIQDVWRNSVTKCAGICTVHFVKTEQYFQKQTSNLVFSIVYTVQLGGNIVSPVMMHAPYTKDFQNGIHVVTPMKYGISGFYVIFTEDPAITLYRSRHTWQISFVGRVDVRQVAELITQVALATRNKTSGFSYNIEYNRVIDKYAVNGDEISSLVLFVTDSASSSPIVLDARSLGVPTSTELMYWFQQSNHTVYYGNMNTYRIYTFSFNDLIPVKTLSHYEINGYLIAEDSDRVAQIIKDAYVTSDSDYNITIYKVEVGYKITGEVVNTFRYLVSYNGIVHHAQYYYGNLPAIVSYINGHLNTANGLGQNYTHMPGAQLYYEQEVMRLLFTSAIAELDYTNVASSIINSLSTGWHSFNSYSSGLTALIIHQEEVFVGDLQYWQISFILKTPYIDPIQTRFVQRVTEKLLETSFKAVSISNQAYTLIDKAYEASTVLRRSWAFTLTFKEMVYEVDWAGFERVIKLEWCRHVGSNCFWEVKIKDQEQVVDRYGAIYWRLVYFIYLEAGAGYFVQNPHTTLLRPSVANYPSQFGFNYTAVNVDYLIDTRFLFTVYTDTEITQVTTGFVDKLKTFFLTHVQGVTLDWWKDTEIRVITQRQVFTSSGWMWRVQFGLVREGGLVNAQTWPTSGLVYLQLVSGSGIETVDWSSFTLDYYFSLYLKGKVSWLDYQKFELAIHHYWMTTHGGCGPCATVHVINQEQLHSYNGSSYNRLDFQIKVNGTVVNPAKYPPIDYSVLGSYMNFTGQGGSYNLEKGIEHTNNLVPWRYYRWMYTNSWISPSQYTIFREHLLRYYSSHYKGLSVEIGFGTQRELFSSSGLYFWGLPYYVKVDGRLVLPFLLPHLDWSTFSLTLNATTSQGNQYQVFTDMNTQPHSGTSTFARDSLYRLMTYERALPHSLLEELLAKSWKHTQQDTNIVVSIISREQYFGMYGVELSGYMYAVKLNGSLVETDFIMEPSLDQYSSQLKPYTKSVSYRLADLHELRVTGTVNKAVIEALQISLANAWTSQSAGSRNVSTKVVAVTLSVDMATGTMVHRLSYALTINDVPMTSWEVRPLTAERTQRAVTDVSSVSQIEVWLNVTNILKQIYLQGRSLSDTTSQESVKQTLVKTWAISKNVSESSVAIQLVKDATQRDDLFVTDDWTSVTKLSYGLSVNGHDTTDPIKDSLLSNQLTANGFQLVNGTLLKRWKRYIHGQRSQQNATALSSALSLAWMETNKDLNRDSLEVRIKGMGASRHRREVTSSSEQYTLVDTQGEEVSPLEFTVAVDGFEPNPVLLAAPSEGVLNKNLVQANTATCGCSPLAQGHVTLVGKTKTTEQAAIEDAITEAIVSENKGLNATSISVGVVELRDGEDNSKALSIVLYRVTCVDPACDVEAILAPSQAVLKQMLANAGHTLYAKAEPVQSEDKPNWLIPVAIACGVVLLVIIISVGCCIAYRRRHRKMGDFIQQEQNIKTNNVYDKEHFSEMAVFENLGVEEDGNFREKM